LKSSKKNDGLSPAGFVALGRLVNTHGVRGELRLLPYAFPCPTIRKGLVIQLQNPLKDLQDSKAPNDTNTKAECQSAVVEKVRLHKPFVLITLEGISSREQAHALRNMTVAVEEHELPPLEDGEFYYYQVIGLTVLTTSGEEIGTIAEVFFPGGHDVGHDVWVVQKGKQEYLIPATEEIVRRIDIPNKQAVIEPLDGLLD
jgi:16S rRNA processing protein RimM